MKMKDAGIVRGMFSKYISKHIFEKLPVLIGPLSAFQPFSHPLKF